jgi:hypothetical protein
MKIYIVNITPQSLKNKIKNMVESFEYNEKITYELHSQDFGLHILEDDKMYLNESTFKSDYELIKGYTISDCLIKYDLLIDKQERKNIPVISQLPVNYIITKFHIFEFKNNKKSNLTLKIECIEEVENFERKLIPVNFYFNYKNEEKILDLNDAFFQEEFNVFLSMLN